MIHVAKLIEALGLGFVTYALVVGFTQDHSMGPELTWMMVGAVVFIAGRLLEGRASA